MVSTLLESVDIHVHFCRCFDRENYERTVQQKIKERKEERKELRQ